MNKNIRFLYLAILLFSIVSCSAEKSPGSEDNQECARAVMDLSYVLIPKSQVSVYADISAYDLTNTIVQTKSSEETVNLESLLDRSKAVQYSFKSGVYYQIPFFQNEDDVLADVSEDESPDIASATRVKKFYMELTQDGTLYHYVVTMFTSAQYFKNNPNFDFRHKPNYSGVILFSTVQGKIFDVNYYHDGLVIDASILTREEIESGNYENLHYVKLYQSIPVTRSQTPIEIDGGEIEGSICVAEGNHGNQGNNNDNDDWPDDTIIPDFGGGGGGSGAPSQGSGSGGGRNNKTPLLNEPSYSINLSTNEPEEYSVQGSGVYVDGTLISISCTFIGVIPGYLPFSRWIGDFKQYSTPYFQHVVSEDIVSTAIFGYGGPCHDKARGVTNPAKQMSIAATSSGSYYGGTFGMTRNGGTKKHTGVDIAATPGTELYAMYSGTVHMVQTKYNEDKYVKGSYGNEIVIKCSINGQYYYFQYSHLHYREPIAINPRTRLPFKEGDEVFEGDMIAYSGKTGNAYRDKDVPNKHLHLGVSTDWQVSRRNNNWIDPAPFLNGTINVDKNHPYSGGTIDNIKCD